MYAIRSYYDEKVTALIEVKVTPQRGQGFDKIAERIYKFDEVEAVYLMSGGFDLTVVIHGKTMREVATFVSERLAPMDAVLSTATHFVLKKYKEHGIPLVGEVHDRITSYNVCYTKLLRILDGVFNHCGSFNKWMDKEGIYKDAKGYEPGAYHKKDSYNFV